MSRPAAAFSLQSVTERFRRLPCLFIADMGIAHGRADILVAEQFLDFPQILSHRIMASGGINFAGSQFVFAGYSGEPFSNRAFNLRLRAACRALGLGEITTHGLRHSAATILLNQVGKDLREIQELLRHKNIRTTVRYTHVGYEQTRQTAEELSRALE